jgi:hypothetical protein
MQAPPVLEPTLGKLLVALGVALVLGGWHALWVHGGGLPMNAFPPPKLVTRGVFALVPHPIYFGFCLGLFGARDVDRRGGGLLVHRADRLARGARAALRLRAALARGSLRRESDRSRGSRCPHGVGAPSVAERLSVFGTLLAPWALLYESVTRLGRAARRRVDLPRLRGLDAALHGELSLLRERLRGGDCGALLGRANLSRAARLRRARLGGVSRGLSAVLVLAVRRGASPPAERRAVRRAHRGRACSSTRRVARCRRST